MNIDTTATWLPAVITGAVTIMALLVTQTILLVLEWRRVNETRNSRWLQTQREAYAQLLAVSHRLIQETELARDKAAFEAKYHDADYIRPKDILDPWESSQLVRELDERFATVQMLGSPTVITAALALRQEVAHLVVNWKGWNARSLHDSYIAAVRKELGIAPLPESTW